MVPGEELMEHVLDLARRIAANPRLAVRWTKMSLNRRLEEEVLLGQLPASSLEWLSLQMGDHKEAIRAYEENRPPEYTGR